MYLEYAGFLFLGKITISPSFMQLLPTGHE